MPAESAVGVHAPRADIPAGLDSLGQWRTAVVALVSHQVSQYLLGRGNKRLCDRSASGH